MPDKTLDQRLLMMDDGPDISLARIRARPFTLWAQQGYSILATNLKGEVQPEKAYGLFERNTRYLSRYLWTVNHEPLDVVTVQPASHHALLGYYRAQASGTIPENGLQVQLARMIAQGMHEDVSVTNYTEQALPFELGLSVDADFIDIMEITMEKREQWGALTQTWDPENRRLRFDYQVEDLNHGLILHLKSEAVPRYLDGALAWELSLQPGQTFHFCVDVEPIYCGEHLKPLYGCYQFNTNAGSRDRLQAQWLEQSTRLACQNAMVEQAYESARMDLAMMRLWEEDSGPDAWIPAAGLPMYVGVFGRDTLTAGWQAGLMGPEMMHGAVETMKKYQATEFDDWRDEQPGKMIHEARLGPLSLLDRIPQKRYYGSTTSTPLYLITLSELYHWQGDTRLLERHKKPMDKALEWIERYGDLDGDGFYEYQTLSSQGLRNQGWKDSDEGIVYADGSIVPTPIATCEEQGWVYEAKVRASMMYTALKEFKKADRLIHEAHQLKEQFNREFWMPGENFFALALDPDKRQVASITSNPGHCLATGIVDEEKAAPTVGRMMSPDLFSGWGIRTLSSKHPRYNPYAYHLGSVWPVENGTFCMAFVRYGFHRHAGQLAKAVFEASRFFEYGRLPEAMSGYPRSEAYPFPSIYPNSCMPQAWSSSAVAVMIQAMLGLYPFAPMRLLLLDPHLPIWLPELTLHHLRVGNATVSLRFWRDPDGKTHHRVLEKQGKLRVVPHLVNIHKFHQLKNFAESVLTR